MRRGIVFPDVPYGKTSIAGIGPFLFDPAYVSETGEIAHGLGTDKDAKIDELQNNTLSLQGVNGKLNSLEARVAELERIMPALNSINEAS